MMEVTTLLWMPWERRRDETRAEDEGGKDRGHFTRFRGERGTPDGGGEREKEKPRNPKKNSRIFS